MRFIILILLTAFTQKVLAQENTQEIDISELKTPTSPAFALLGVTPNEISRPKSQNDLEIALMNAFYKDKAQLPKDFAFETNPYWLFRKKPMSVQEWYTTNFGEQLLQNLALSIATAPRQDPENVNKEHQQLSVGFRTQFHPLFSNENSQILDFVKARNEFADKAWVYTQLHGAIAIAATYNSASYTVLSQQAKLDHILGLISTNLPSTSPFNTPLYASKLALVQAAITNVRLRLPEITVDVISDATFKEALRKIESFIKTDLEAVVDWRGMVSRMRETYSGTHTFLIELGSAYALHFSDSLISSGNSSRFGVWVSPTYRTPIDNKRIIQGEVIGMVRYIEDFVRPDSIVYNRNLDLGIRATIRIQRFSISGEAIYRSNWQADKSDKITVNGIDYYSGNKYQVDDWKASVNIEYRATNSLSVTYTFGKDFGTSPVRHGGNLVNMLGVNLGLFPAIAK